MELATASCVDTRVKEAGYGASYSLVCRAVPVPRSSPPAVLAWDQGSGQNRDPGRRWWR